MSETQDSGDMNETELSTKNLRKRYASGWMELTKNRSVPFIIDALLDFSPEKEFNKTELARKSGVSRESVRKYTTLLLELDILEEVPDTREPRYRLNDKGTVTKKLFELNGAVGAVRAQNTESNQSSNSRTYKKYWSYSSIEEKLKNVSEIIESRPRLDA